MLHLRELERQCAARLSAGRMCHASTVLPLESGEVLCAFFSGSHEGSADTSIYLSRRTPEGVWNEGADPAGHKLFGADEAHWNPVLFHTPDGRLALIYKRGEVIARWRSYISFAEDPRGLAWTAPRELVPGDEGGRGPVRNPPLILPGGRILFPGSREDGRWRAFVDRSDDNLITLKRSNEITLSPEDLAIGAGRRGDIAVSEQSFTGQGVIQPTLYADSGGVHMLLRSTCGFVMRSDSFDEGESWSAPYRTELPNNNSGIDCELLEEGCLVVACNPIAGNWAERSVLSLYRSADGRAFEPLLTLEEEPGEEFSYPCVRRRGERLYVSYTFKRREIVVREFVICRD